jgi:hypothetical protein
MATPSRQTLNVTELDFDAIKENIKTYFKTADSQFKDWDYVGSGLNQLLDVLAYNTHYNAMLAHMALNETFIDSAQLRSSVVSNAKLIGYIPRSKASAAASLTVSFNGNNQSQSYITLPRGSNFKTSLNGKTYVFLNLDELIINLDAEANTYTKTIEVRQGSIETKRFQVNNVSEKLTYQIDDDNIDVSTLIVRVYNSTAQQTADIYTLFTEANIGSINNASQIYFLTENVYGKYQIEFGNNIFGKRPNNLSIIEIEYLTTAGADCNGALSFQYISSLPTGTIGILPIVTVNKATGGNSKEDIESIRFNAPNSFVSQNRAVTADDYKTIITAKFPSTQSIAVWGGEDNDPPQYGKAFICVKPKDALYLTAAQKAEILNIVKYKKVLSITPEFVDPEYINLSLDVLFKYNSSKTNLSKGELEGKIYTTVKEFDAAYLESFDGVFRHSALLKTIDTYSPAILNSLVRVYVSKSFVVDPQNASKNIIYYNTRLTNDEYGHTIIVSSPFYIKSNQCFYSDEAIDGDTVYRRVYTYYLGDNNVQVKVNSDAGRINVVTGKVELAELYVDETTTITLNLLPASNDIAPKKNQLIRIDMNQVYVSGEIDSIDVGGSSRTIDYNTFKRDR